ncbi:hypothetical protein [Fretibacter rubidus]|uniref:hypothetical protein n=1 Tax=Fretibacter rubidus TaxID=570162 RepID=UPI00352A8FCB
MDKTKRVTLDVFAITIAFIAAGFTGWQILETREHNRLALRPHLDVSLKGSNDLTFRSLRVDNAGLGPAFIESMNFTLDDVPILRETYKDDGTPQREYLQIVLDKIGWPRDDASRNRILRTTLPKGAVLSPGSEVHIFKIISDLSDDEYQQFRELELDIIYRSTYNETCRVIFNPKKEDAYTHFPCK